MIVPAAYQPPLPLDQLLLPVGAPGAGERMELDVLIVGAGPAGLACAIELARLGRDARSRTQPRRAREGRRTGRTLSVWGGRQSARVPRAVPRPEDADFPFRGPVGKEAVYLLTAEGRLRLPTPPTMHNKGHYVASLCEMVRWLGAQAEALGVNIFTGFPAASLLVDGKRVAGVRTAASGLDRERKPARELQTPTDLVATVTALAEGTRGTLSQAYLEWQKVSSPNPQIFALGVKEIWETKRPLDAVMHTLGWPLPTDAFGGSFMYPLEPNLVALGLVVGLDYQDRDLDVHVLFQRMKLHPLFRPYLEGGEMVEWGAKTIPEGGYYSRARPPLGRRRRDPRRFGGVRGCAIPERNSLRDAVGDIRRPRDSRGAQRRRPVRGEPRRLRPDGERVVHHGRPVPHPQHATRVQGRLLRGRRESGADVTHGRRGFRAGRSQ